MCFYEEVEKQIWSEELEKTDENSLYYPLLVSLADKAAGDYNNVISLINFAKDDYTKQIITMRSIERRHYFQIGQFFGVSEDCIRKICQRHKQRYLAQIGGAV